MVVRRTLAGCALAAVAAAAYAETPILRLPPSVYLKMRQAALRRKTPALPPISPNSAANASAQTPNVAQAPAPVAADPVQTPVQPTTPPPVQPATPAPIQVQPPSSTPVAPAQPTVQNGHTRASMPNSALKWMNDSIVKRIDISGHRTLGYSMESVSGDTDAYNTLNNYGEGSSRFTDIGDMTVEGHKVLGVLDFQMHYTDNRIQEPDSQQMTLNYARGPVSLSYGDIRGSLVGGNRFASFNKQLNGIMAGFRSGRFQFKAIGSQVRGTSRTVSLQGNNSAGPYYLESGQVLPDTVQVQLDGKTLKLTDDYVVDAQLGAITFVNQVIPPTSTIVATYESADLTGSTGDLEAAGATYDFGRLGQVGFTAMQQTETGTSDSGAIADYFQGYGDPSLPYTLRYQPIPATVVVTVDGQTQIQAPSNVPGSGDYYINAADPLQIYFFRPIASTQTIIVKYRPVVSNAVEGDRRTVGFDYRLPLGKKGSGGYIQYSQARGETFNTSNPTGATARGVDANYRFGDYTFTGSTHDIPTNFVTVETAGFNRNENATQLGLTYSHKRIDYGVSTTNSSISTATTAVNGTIEYDNSRYTTADAYIHYSDVGGTRWSLEQSRTASHDPYDTRLDTTSISANRRFGNLTSSLSTQYQTGSGMITSGTGEAMGDVRLETLSLSNTFAAGHGLSFNGKFDVSSIDAGGQSGNGTDVTLGASYKPSDKWSIATTYVRSDSGAVATLGAFASGAGTGYNGSGFSSATSGDTFSSGVSSLTTFAVSSAVKASDRLNFNVRFNRTRSEGDLASNTESEAYGAGVEWDLGRFTLLSLSLDQTNTDFIGTLGTTSAATTLDCSLLGSPKGKWSYRVGLSSLLSSGSSAYGQNSLSYDASLTYRLAQRQRISFSLTNSSTTGYYAQSDNYFALIHQYQIFRNIALVSSYKIRDVRNLDPTVTTGAYKARGFDFELSFDFAP